MELELGSWELEILRDALSITELQLLDPRLGWVHLGMNLVCKPIWGRAALF